MTLVLHLAVLLPFFWRRRRTRLSCERKRAPMASWFAPFQAAAVLVAHFAARGNADAAAEEVKLMLCSWFLFVGWHRVASLHSKCFCLFCIDSAFRFYVLLRQEWSPDIKASFAP